MAPEPAGLDGVRAWLVQLWVTYDMIFSRGLWWRKECEN